MAFRDDSSRSPSSGEESRSGFGSARFQLGGFDEYLDDSAFSHGKISDVHAYGLPACDEESPEGWQSYADTFEDFAPRIKAESPNELPALNGVTLADVQAPPPVASTSYAPVAAPPSQLLVIGLPERVARSRVETQFQIELRLVAGQPVIGFLASDGTLVPSALAGTTAVSRWSHLRLPKHLALKRLGKRDFRQPTSPPDTLYADVSVVKASEPEVAILACDACVEREKKRGQRRKDSKRKPHQDVDEAQLDEDPTDVSDPEQEMRKAVVFNCGQYLDLDQGVLRLPARLTCYCRHHSEQQGFRCVMDGFGLTHAAYRSCSRTAMARLSHEPCRRRC